MYKVTKELEFCYGHRLMDYVGKCQHLHGHNGKLAIELSAERLDRRGMVRDFNDMKHRIQTWIDANLDHKMILRKGDPAIVLLNKLGEPMFVMDENPTAEGLAKLLYEAVRTLGFPVTSVTLWETPQSFATYHPTRGRR